MGDGMTPRCPMCASVLRLLDHEDAAVCAEHGHIARRVFARCWTEQLDPVHALIEIRAAQANREIRTMGQTARVDVIVKLWEFWHHEFGPGRRHAP